MFQLASIVADDALEGELDAQQIELLGDEERIGVTFAGVSISLPTAMIARARKAFLPAADCPLPATFMSATRAADGRAPHQKISVDARHDVIEHDTKAAGQQLEPPRRPGLHDVQHPEDEKTDDRAGDVDRDEARA